MQQRFANSYSVRGGESVVPEIVLREREIGEPIRQGWRRKRRSEVTHFIGPKARELLVMLQLLELPPKAYTTRGPNAV